MRTQPKVASSLAWGSVLWAGPSRSRASAVSHSAIHAASRRKYESISSPRPKQRALKLSSNGSFSEQNSNLSPDQFQQCVSDLVAADGNLDGRLDKAEYLMFLSLNAANYGYSWGYAANQASLSDLPLEFPMLFHTTACLCAYDQLPVSFDCCEGENGHIVVYAEGGVPNAEGMAADEAAYTRMFCTEAFYSYAVTFAPTESPTVRPTSSPETPLPTTKPSSAETPTTENPTMKSTGSPAGEPVPMAPTAKPVDAVPTEPTAPPNADPSTSAPTPLVVTPSPTKVTAIPVETPTASPTIAKTPTSRRPTPISSTNTPTASPNARPITPSPTESPSGGPTSGPTAAASTSSPAMTTKPPTDSLTPEPTPNPTRDPTTSPTAKPTALPTPSPSLPPTPPPASSLLEVDVTYGISSNCGMTAVDVMNGNYGITIREGLETATEAVVIEILNGTYPRDAMASMMSPGQGVRTKFGQLRDHALAGSHATSGRYHPAAESLPGEGVRMRVNGLPQEFGSRRDLAILEPRRQPRSNRQFRSGNVGSLRRQRRRSLVYYTTEYPAVITEMEDVQCEPQTTCMRVRSRVILVLEEGDDPVMIEQEVSSRIQASIQDGSLFDVSCCCAIWLWSDVALCAARLALSFAAHALAHEPATRALSRRRRKYRWIPSFAPPPQTARRLRPRSRGPRPGGRPFRRSRPQVRQSHRRPSTRPPPRRRRVPPSPGRRKPPHTPGAPSRSSFSTSSRTTAASRAPSS